MSPARGSSGPSWLPMLPLCAALLALAPPASAAVPVPPVPEHFVTDSAGVLTLARAEALADKLEAFERETTAQVLVWIAPRVPQGTTPEELGAEAIRVWGVGQKGKDNGAVLFVFTQDRKLRLATGYGLEGAIPDVVAKRILADVVKPHLAKGDYDGGVEAGVDAILSAVRKEGAASAAEVAGATDAPASAAPAEGGNGEVIFHSALLCWAVVLVTVWAFALRRRSTRLLILGMYLAVPLLPLLLGAALTVGILNWRRGKRGQPELLAWVDLGRKGSSSSSFGSSSWSSRSSSSSSSSGFSGGGGSSGGGGASDSY